MKTKELPHPLQSQEWGEFRKKWGNELVKTPYGILTLHKIPFTPFKLGMFIKGPTPTPEMLKYLKKYAQENRILFIKLEPNASRETLGDDSYKKTINFLQEHGAVRGKTLFTPTTFWLDLTKTEDALLAGFTSKTRYNIRLSQRYDVTVREDNSPEAFNSYIKLTRETVQRQGFYAHSERYHRLMWKTLHEDMVKKGKKPIARLLAATYKGEIITTWILFAYNDFLYYPYGASSDKYKQVMANNLVMWEAIRFGKKLKLKTFDLWGREEGKGFTKFKEGYNPQVVEFLGTWDLVASPLYWTYLMAEYIRWKILRLKSKYTEPRF